MEIELMKEFIVLSKTLNYTAAADQLFLSQPTLTKHINLIEKELNAELFKRNKHYVELTESGRLFLSECEVITARYTSFLDKLSMIKSGYSGKIKLGVLYYAIARFVTPIIIRMSSDYPDVNISLSSYKPLSLWRDLESGEVDASITYRCNGVSMFENIGYIDLAKESFCLLVSDKSPYAKREKISLSEISDITICIQKQTPMLGKYIQQSLTNKHASNIQYYLTDHVDTMVTDMLIHQGGALTTVQSAENLARGGIVSIPITDPDFYVIQTCAYRTDNSNSSLEKLFDTIKKVFPNPDQYL